MNMPARHTTLVVLGLLAVGLVSLAGCRVDEPEPPTLASEGPPVVAGDTARADSTYAAQAEPERPLTDPAPPVTSASGLVLPVDGIRPEDLVDTFTAARSEGRVHNAIDIMAPRGTAVRAAADGEIARLFESERGGLTIYQIGDLSAAGVRVYYYAHLDDYADGLSAGDAVRAGDVIGTVGDSGNAAPGYMHLHFAIWDAPSSDNFWDGNPVNPYLLLAP